MMFQLLVSGDAPAEPVNGAYHPNVYPVYAVGVVAWATPATTKATIVFASEDMVVCAVSTYLSDDCASSIYKKRSGRSEVMAPPDNVEGVCEGEDCLNLERREDEKVCSLEIHICGEYVQLIFVLVKRFCLQPRIPRSTRSSRSVKHLGTHARASVHLTRCVTGSSQMQLSWLTQNLP